MDSKISVAIISVLVASMVLVAGLPLISGIMGDTVTATNEGAGDLRFNLVDSHVSYTVSIAQNLDDTGIEITNGSDVQTLLYDDASIIYADDNIAIWYDLNDLKLICPNNGAYVSGNINDDVQVSRTASGVEVSIGDPAEVLTFPAPTWAYVANSTGKYGYFDNGTEITVPTGTPLATVGSYAGVDCYNSHNNYDLPLSLDLTQTDNKLSGAKWISAIVEDEQDAKAVKEIVLIDDDEKEIKDDLGSMVKGVPTPTYTDGDWGYNTTTVDGVTKAKIVSYSGVGGGVITVPSTVGGYDVYQFGIGIYGQTVFDPSLTATDLIISSGIEILADSCCYGITGFTGNLVIPDSVTTIGEGAFQVSSGFTGDLVIPDSVTTIGQYAFQKCKFTSLKLGDNLISVDSYAFYECKDLTGDLVIPDSVTTINGSAFYGLSGLNGILILPNVNTIGNSAFRNCYNITSLVIYCDSNITIGTNVLAGETNLKNVLNLGSLELTTTSYGLNADEVREDVPAMGYLSAVEYTEGGVHTGPTYDLIAILPLVLSAGLVLFCIAVLIRRV